MRCLVTGGAGFIGSHLTDRLIAEGHAVVILDNLCEQVHPQGKPDYLNPAAEFIRGDIRDREIVKRALGKCEAVVHLAAAVGVAQSQYCIHHYSDVNVTGSAVLADILANQKHQVGKIVVAGSMTEYGEGLYRRPSDGRPVRPTVRTESDVARNWDPMDPETGETLEPQSIPESAALEGRSVYALTKRMQEDLFLNLDRTYDIPCLSLRFFNVYGPRQSLSNPYTGVLAIFLAQILADRRPVVYEDGGQSRDFVHVSDVVTAIRNALLQPLRSRCLNIGSGTGTRIGHLAAWLCKELGREMTPNVNGAFRKGDIRHCTADIRAARQELNFIPAISLPDGVSKLVEWARTQSVQDHTDRVLRELAHHRLAS